MLCQLAKYRGRLLGGCGAILYCRLMFAVPRKLLVSSNKVRLNLTFSWNSHGTSIGFFELVVPACYQKCLTVTAVVV